MNTVRNVAKSGGEKKGSSLCSHDSLGSAPGRFSTYLFLLLPSVSFLLVAQRMNRAARGFMFKNLCLSPF